MCRHVCTCTYVCRCYVCICVVWLRHDLQTLVEEPRISISFKNGRSIPESKRVPLIEGVVISFLCSATGSPKPEVSVRTVCVCVCVCGGGGVGVCVCVGGCVCMYLLVHTFFVCAH